MYMYVGFGRYFGLPVELLFLRHPAYVRRVIAVPEPSFSLRKLQNSVLELIEVFDRKPLRTRCTRPRCRKRATVCTVFRGGKEPRWWCASCDPVGEVRRDRNVAIRSFRDACEYVFTYCLEDPEGALRDLVVRLVVAKGLSYHADRAEVSDFFRDD